MSFLTYNNREIKKLTTADLTSRRLQHLEKQLDKQAFMEDTVLRCFEKHETLKHAGPSEALILGPKWPKWMKETQRIPIMFEWRRMHK